MVCSSVDPASVSAVLLSASLRRPLPRPRGFLRSPSAPSADLPRRLLFLPLPRDSVDFSLFSVLFSSSCRPRPRPPRLPERLLRRCPCPRPSAVRAPLPLRAVLVLFDSLVFSSVVSAASFSAAAPAPNSDVTAPKIRLKPPVFALCASPFTAVSAETLRLAGVGAGANGVTALTAAASGFFSSRAS